MHPPAFVTTSISSLYFRSSIYIYIFITILLGGGASTWNIAFAFFSLYFPLLIPLSRHTTSSGIDHRVQYSKFSEVCKLIHAEYETKQQHGHENLIVAVLTPPPPPPHPNFSSTAPSLLSICQKKGILRFYTDDAPGLRIGPTVVLVFSLAFIGCVVLLHIWGKFKG